MRGTYLRLRSLEEYLVLLRQVVEEFTTESLAPSKDGEEIRLPGL